MPARTNNIQESLATNIPKIFDQAQNSTANHQKNLVALHKIHAEAANFTEPTQDGKSIKLTGEKLFEDAFIDMLCRTVLVKKGTSQGDRIVKFVGSYTRFINEKAAGIKKEDDDDNDDDDTTASRFVRRLLKFLREGFLARDKVARYRCVHILAEMVAHLGEIDEDDYLKLRAKLIERVHDKETFVRVQAVVALSKLCGSEDPSDVGEGEPTAIEVLLDILSCDPAADVRRATLLNIPLTPATLNAVLGRTRDTDTVMRKLVYSNILDVNCHTADGGIGVVHPRTLTIAQRELIIRNGLGDREPTVRSAAGSLVGTWVDAPKSEEGKGVDEDVVTFLKLFDLQESTIAEDALLSVFATRPDILDNLEFGEPFWSDLSPERAFLARVLVEHCLSTKDEAKLDTVLPVVTELAYRIQNAYNDYQESMDAAEQERSLRGEDAEDEAKKDDEKMDREFTIGEMLKLTVNLDYSDEIGRRKMFKLVRDMISQDSLPDSLVSRCLDVLRMLSPNERDLIRVVVEVVHELRDPDPADSEEIVKEPADDAETNFGGSPVTAKHASRGEPKPPSEMTPEERARADAIDIRCLSLCIGMLERVNGTFEENSTLEGILGELIIPAVKRKELALREKGLVCLGLCCLIARRMALNSFQLFLGQVQSAPEVLKIRVLQIVFDILMVHEGDFLGKGSVGGDRIVEFLLSILNNEDSEKVQALLCIGIAKLVLAGMISDEKVLKSLVVAYLSPDTVDNQELRQCLSYFFPVYCYSSAVNQRRMKQIFIPIFEQLAEASRELDEDQEMVSPAQIAGMFGDWTDPRKAIEVQGQTPDETIHVDLAGDVLKELYNKELQKDDSKVLCQMLGRLHIPDTVDDDKIRTLKLLMHNLQSRRPIRDTTAKNAFVKFDAAISKKFAKQLEDFNEEDYRQLEHLKELFEFLDDIIPEDDGEEIELPKTRGRKRRSESIATETTNSAPENDSRATSIASSSGKGKGKAKQSKRRRISGSDVESSDDELSENHVTPKPSRVLPKRAASAKKAPVQVIISDEGEDDDDEEEEEEVKSPSRKPEPPNKASKLATRAGENPPEIDELGGEESFDSIMDEEEDEDEEDEVDDILAPDE